MDLLLLKGAERTRAITQALNIKVTIAQLRTWWPKCPDNFDCSGNGMEVVALVGGRAYEARKQANALAKVAKEDAKRTDAALAEAGEMPDVIPDVDALGKAHEAARMQRLELETRDKESKRIAAATQAQAAEAAQLRDKATTRRIPVHALASAESQYADVSQEHAALEAEITAMKTRLAELVARAGDVSLRAGKLQDTVHDHQRANTEADDLEKRAAAIEASEHALAATPVDPGQLAAATIVEATAKAKLQAAVLAAGKFEKMAGLRAAAQAAKVKADATAAEAKRLDGVVKALTVEAPAALLATADVPKGFALTADGPELDGKKLDLLSDGERVWFAVELARRANEKSKILVVDRLESIAPDLQERFKRDATRGGYQLIAAKADAGDLVFEAISEEP
jgi:hypothetical protein